MTVPTINQGSFPLASATNGDPFSCIAGGNLAQSSQIMSYNPASVAITGGTIASNVLGFRWRTVATLGDSIISADSTNQGVVDPGVSSPSSSNYSHGIVTNFAAISQKDVSQVFNGGYSGQRSDYVLTQAASALATSPDVLIELCGVNDLAQLATTFAGNSTACENAIVTNRTAIWDAARAKGVPTVALSLTPVGNLGGFTSAARYCLQRVNARLKKIAAARRDTIWVDIHEIGVDPADANSYPRTNYALDTLHPSALFAYKIGQRLSTVIGSRFAPTGNLISAQLDSLFSDSASLNFLNPVNGMFVGGTAGSAGSGISGTVHTGWTVDRGSSSGAPTGVASIVTAADGVGNAQRVVATANNPGESLRFLARTAPLISQLPAGSKVEVFFKVNVTSQTNLRSVQAATKIYFTGGIQSSPMASFSLSVSGGPGVVALPDTTYEMLVRVPPVYVPTDAVSIQFLDLEVIPQFNAAGSATVDISRVSFRATLPG